jgi:hypothetical protein
MPSGIQETIMSSLFDAEGNRLSSSVRFAFEVAVIRAANPAGYSWVYSPLLAASAHNPLDAIKAEVAALAVPKPAPALEAPASKKK